MVLFWYVLLMVINMIKLRILGTKWKLVMHRWMMREDMAKTDSCSPICECLCSDIQWYMLLFTSGWFIWTIVGSFSRQLEGLCWGQQCHWLVKQGKTMLIMTYDWIHLKYIINCLTSGYLIHHPVMSQDIGYRISETSKILGLPEEACGAVGLLDIDFWMIPVDINTRVLVSWLKSPWNCWHTMIYLDIPMYIYIYIHPASWLIYPLSPISDSGKCPFFFTILTGPAGMVLEVDADQSLGLVMGLMGGN